MSAPLTEAPATANEKEIDIQDLLARCGQIVVTTGAAAKLMKVSQQTIIRCFDTALLQGFRLQTAKKNHARRVSLASIVLYMTANGMEMFLPNVQAFLEKKNAPAADESEVEPEDALHEVKGGTKAHPKNEEDTAQTPVAMIGDRQEANELTAEFRELGDAKIVLLGTMNLVELGSILAKNQCMALLVSESAVTVMPYSSAKIPGLVADAMPETIPAILLRTKGSKDTEAGGSYDAVIEKSTARETAAKIYELLGLKFH